MISWKSVEQGMPEEMGWYWAYDSRDKQVTHLFWGDGKWHPHYTFWKPIQYPLPPCSLMPLHDCEPAEDWNGKQEDIRCQNCSDPEKVDKYVKWVQKQHERQREYINLARKQYCLECKRERTADNESEFELDQSILPGTDYEYPYCKPGYGCYEIKKAS